MSALPSMSPEAVREAQVEIPEPEPACTDSALLAIPAAPSTSGETFEEELLRDAYLPRDGMPT